MWFDKAKEQIEKTNGTVGLLVKNLTTGETFSHNAEAGFPSASVIKVPILVTLLDAVAAGELELTARIPVAPADIVSGSGVIRFLSEGLPFTLLDHAMLMIDFSDNIATNHLISVLGMERINARCKELEMHDTVLARKMMDFEAKMQGRDNLTSCRDLLAIFAHMHSNTEKYATAFKILRQQTLNNLLPGAFAEDTLDFAHKTGGLDGVRHDVGILYRSDPIFVALLTKDLQCEYEGVRLANDIGCLLCTAFPA